MRRVVLLVLLVLLTAAACGPTGASAVCKKYVACEQDYEQASGTGTVDLSQYEDDGTCWKSAQNGQTCDQQCTDGLAAVRQAADDAGLDVASCR